VRSLRSGGSPPRRCRGTCVSPRRLRPHRRAAQRDDPQRGRGHAEQHVGPGSGPAGKRASPRPPAPAGLRWSRPGDRVARRVAAATRGRTRSPASRARWESSHGRHRDQRGKEVRARPCDHELGRLRERRGAQQRQRQEGKHAPWHGAPPAPREQRGKGQQQRDRAQPGQRGDGRVEPTIAHACSPARPAVSTAGAWQVSPAQTSRAPAASAATAPTASSNASSARLAWRGRLRRPFCGRSPHAPSDHGARPNIAKTKMPGIANASGAGQGAI